MANRPTARFPTGGAGAARPPRATILPARALRALPPAVNDNRQPWPLRLRRAAGILLPAVAAVLLLALMFWLS